MNAVSCGAESWRRHRVGNGRWTHRAVGTRLDRGGQPPGRPRVRQRRDPQPAAPRPASIRRLQLAGPEQPPRPEMPLRCQATSESSTPGGSRTAISGDRRSEGGLLPRQLGAGDGRRCTSSGPSECAWRGASHATGGRCASLTPAAPREPELRGRWQATRGATALIMATRWRALCCHVGRCPRRLSHSSLAWSISLFNRLLHDAPCSAERTDRTPRLRTRFTMSAKARLCARRRACSGGYGPAPAGLGYRRIAALFASRLVAGTDVGW